jgi:hypothetical protein
MSIDKEQLAAICEQLGLEYNTLSKAQALAFIALTIAEARGLEPAEGLAIAELLDDLASVNYSALRQKLAKVIWGKDIPKGVRQNAASLAAQYIKASNKES